MGLDLPAGASAGDLIAILALIAPGFLVLYLVTSFRGRRITDNALVLSLASLLVSGFLALFFLAWNRISNESDVAAFVLTRPLTTAGEFLLLSLLASVAAALYEELDPIGRVVRWAITKKNRREIRAQNIWDAYLEDNLDNPVLIESREGRLIGGFLRRRSESEDGEPNAVVLVKPALVTRDASGNLSGVQLGRTMLLQAEDIRTVTVLDGPRVDGTGQPPLGEP
ncbi:MAG: hypothetical protein QOE90_5 [Thermoplasmata archaeon]|jgi:hypothetical protein|nr:hypothetical protein [Thermoplasmata archaeon]